MKWLVLLVLAVASSVFADDRIIYAADVSGEFDHIVLQAPITVEVQQGEDYKIWVKTPPLLRDNLVLRQKGKRLYVGWKADERWLNMVDRDSVKVKIELPSISVLEAQGSGNLYVGDMTLNNLTYNNSGSGDAYIGNLVAEKISVALQGSGDLEVISLAVSRIALASMGSSDISIGRLDTQDLNINSAGNGDITIVDQSSADSADISLLGNGDVEAMPLHVVSANISLLGSSDIEITVNERLNASVMGSGDIVYGGSPASVDLNQFGSGDVRAAGEDNDS
ncbi:GIN domain-containing protein [Bacterioplanes sanyensis]|nr:DUF2807 domain-containing protein [Bacterioplanes sanyensis]